MRYFQVAVIIGLLGGLSTANASIGEIISMQVRPSADYSVVCKSGIFETVSITDVVNNTVCQPLPPTIQDGTYVATGSGLCNMKLTGTSSGGVTSAIRLDFPTCNGAFLVATCTNEVCEGKSAGQSIRVTLHDSTHFRWENLVTTSSVGDFTRTGDLSMPVMRMQSLDPNSPRAAGQPLN